MTDSIIRSVFSMSTSTFVPFVVQEPVVLLLDDFPSATGAYSFRKLREAYAGSAVRIRRSSDNAEADIGFSGNNFDSAAAASHIGGGSGFIVTWYDQSGNGRNVGTSTAAEQYDYKVPGASGFQGFAALEPGGGATVIRSAVAMSNFITVSTGYIVGAVKQNSAFIGTAANAYQRPAYVSESGSWMGLHTRDTPSVTAYADDGGGADDSIKSVSAAPFSMIVEWVHTGGQLTCGVNGVDASSVASGNTNSLAGTLDIGSAAAGGTATGARHAEYVFWNTIPDRSGVRANINAYYAVY